MKTTTPLSLNGLFNPLRVLLALTLVLFFSLSAHAKLFRTGPLDEPSPPGNGYPLWYQDTSGLVLDLCLPRNQAQLDAGICLITPPDNTTVPPTPGFNLPLVFPTNFPDESFWWNGTAVMDIDADNRAVLVLALEAAFSTGDVIAGAQVAFGRVRIIVDAPVDGTYTVTHPYGVQVFNDVVAGQRAITFTSDIGIGAPGDFSGALDSGVGPFLRASATPGGPPADYVTVPGDTSGDRFLADPAIPVNVTGSPFDTNFFKICVSPGTLDGVNACKTINDFTLMGKVHTGPVGSPLTIERSTYSRDANGAHVEVYATATPQPGALAPRLFFGDAAGTNLMPSRFMRGPTGQGLYYGQSIPGNAATLPANIIVTNINDAAPSSATRALVDDVKILGANYFPGNGNLIIRATSSDKVSPRPSLSVIGLPGSTGSETMLFDETSGVYSLTYTVPPAAPPAANRVPPMTVNVISSAGGQANEPVLTAGIGGNFLPGGPVAADDTVSVVAGSVPSVAINVVANDAGYQTGPGSITIPVLPESGSVSVNQATGVITYIFPAQSTPGEVTFAYVVRNGNNIRSNMATVTVITTQ